MRKLLLMIALVISPTFAHDNLELEALFKGHNIAYNQQGSRNHHANAGDVPANHQDENKPGLSDEEKKSLERLVATIEGMNNKIDADHEHPNAFHEKNDNDADANSGRPEFKSKFGSNFNGLPGGGYYSGSGSKGAGSNGGGAGGSGGSGAGNTKPGNPDVPNDTQTATAVPEPSAYLMMLAGLSLITLAVRRKSVKI